jgi:feruloyl-CoA synthase
VNEIARPTRAVRLGPRDVRFERRADGALLLRSAYELGAYPAKITEKLEYWAAHGPDRVFLAQRDPAGGWRTLTYAQALENARAVGAALLQRKLSAERPLVVLSGNDLEHALLELGALYVGIPYAPLSPGYSLLSSDFGKLRAIFELLTPGLVYASDAKAFGKAIGAAVPAGVEVIHDVPTGEDTEKAEAAHARVGPDTIAKFLFTSGSTGAPKAVINTQRMWCANQRMILHALPFFESEPPVLVDWAPWHHTAAGNHDFGLVLYNGGSYYIDEGKPLPGAIEATVRNLREVAPTFYFNVPKGYEALLPYLRKDEALRRNFFSRLRVLWFAGAGISQAVFDEVKALARETRGVDIPFHTGFGATETAPATLFRTWESADASNMGLPPPGAEILLVPLQDRYEARVKGPHITPGYWRQPELTAQAFDEDGWYRLGDAFELGAEGVLFRGRIAEDFKLASGTWVHVGPLRARLLEHFAPLVRDVVIVGEGRSELAALLFPAASAPMDEMRRKLRDFPSTGSSNRISRALVLEQPPSLDAGELTDKGTVNQRAVLARRAALVEELYREPPSERVIWI